jgi:ATP-dependent Clp protease ATP-binding subunit ClpX
VVAKFLDVPFISIDATTLTEAGYIGQNVDTIIMRLLVEANWDISAAENGIVFLDEIDKIANGKTRISTNENKISGVQSALLKMIEGTTIPIATNDLRKTSKSIEINTSNILFIGAGAFTGLNDIVSARPKKKTSMGFTEKVTLPTNIETEYTSDDFIEYGLIPELVGRFPIKTFTKDLSEDELLSVMFNTKNNILSEYKFYFNVDNIDLYFDEEFLKNVVKQVKTEKTGVRGLRAICDSIMMPHLYLIPEYQKRNVAKITFHSGCIDKKEIPKIDIFEREQKSIAKQSKI